MLDRLVTRPLDRERDWHFFREKYPLTDAVRSQIRELSEASARLVWNELVQRNQYRHPNQLPRGHWVGNHRATGPLWTPIWNNPVQPDPVAEFLRRELPWPDDLPVLFVEMRECATLATWAAFLSAWPNFLYSDENPLLVSWERPEFVTFGCGGYVHVGSRAEPGAAADGGGMSAFPGS